MVWFLLSFLCWNISHPRYPLKLQHMNPYDLILTSPVISLWNLKSLFFKRSTQHSISFQIPWNLIKTILLPTSIYKMNFTLARFFLMYFYIYNIYFHRVTYHVRIYDLNHCAPKSCDAWKTFLINKIHTGVDTYRTWISAYKNLTVKIYNLYSS